jgi:hypothetical protein
MAVARPSSTVTVMTHVSGQSWGQTTLATEALIPSSIVSSIVSQAAARL